MEQTYSSILVPYSKHCSASDLEDILKISRIVTISVGIYFPVYYKGYYRLKDLTRLFTKEFEDIISDSRAYCVHNNHTTVIYLYNDNENLNYEVCNQVFMGLKKLQRVLKTIRFSVGIDQRDVKGRGDIITSELMSCFRMFNNVCESVNKEIIHMNKSLSIIGLCKGILNKLIEYNNFNLQSADIMTVSSRLDMLINKFRYSIDY